MRFKLLALTAAASISALIALPHEASAQRFGGGFRAPHRHRLSPREASFRTSRCANSAKTANRGTYSPSMC
jgi:hypothetical protein